MKCMQCGTEGEIKKQFKRKQFLLSPYYICRKCGRANRAEVATLNPAQRGVKKIVQTAKDLTNQYSEGLSQIKLRVLVWGASPNNQAKRALFEKREQIRDRLREKDQEAYFSEELSDVKDERGNPLPCDLAELLQARYFHLIIDVADEGTPGALMEAEKFARVMPIRFLLWLSKSYQGFGSGLVTSLELMRLPPLRFEEEDIKSCIIAMVSEDWVDGMRMLSLAQDIEQKMLDETRIIPRGYIQ